MMDLDVYQNAVLELLANRKQGATICPSEASRLVSAARVAAGQSENWREAMPTVRSAAAKLVALGKLQVTQAGHIVDINTAKGPIRLRLPPHPPK